MTNKEIIISGVNMELTEALKNLVRDKAEKLIRHEDEIIRIRVELGSDHKKGDKVTYTAKGHIEINGPDLNVTEITDDLYKSVDQMITKLDRMLRKRANGYKAKRKQVHKVDVPADIPKSQKVS